MYINASINKRLHHMFVKNFKRELLYYNKNGILFFMTNNYQLNDCDNPQTRDENSYFINDFINNMQKYNERISISFEISPDDVSRFTRIKKTFWNINESILKNETGFRESNSVIINYMMFHILALNGFIELKDFEQNINLYEPERINDLENYDDIQKIILE